jgi:hypothetical protein
MAEALSTHLSYWEARKNFLYYQVVRIIATQVAEDAKSVLDVGSAGCPYLEWFPDAEQRTSLDLRKPYVASGIKSVTSNYLNWDVDQQYDLVLCLQVLEHVPDAGAFAQKLLASGKIVVASVPYKWRGGGARRMSMTRSTRPSSGAVSDHPRQPRSGNGTKPVCASCPAGSSVPAGCGHEARHRAVRLRPQLPYTASRKPRM